jgi:dTMP kinase
MQKPRKADRMEQESPEFYERVRQAYRELAVRESNRMVLLDGSQPADQIEKEIWEKITSRFAMVEGSAPEDASKASVRGVRRSRMDRD